MNKIKCWFGFHSWAFAGSIMSLESEEWDIVICENCRKIILDGRYNL